MSYYKRLSVKCYREDVGVFKGSEGALERTLHVARVNHIESYWKVID